MESAQYHHSLLHFKQLAADVVVAWVCCHATLLLCHCIRLTVHSHAHPQEQMSKIWKTEKHMHPTRLHPETYVRPELALNTKDIKGASTAPPRFTILARDTNPMQPQYQLPTHRAEEAPQPRFLRDSIGVSDIEGAAKQPFQRSREGFTTLGADDIDGACVGWKPYYKAHFNTPEGERDPIDVSDINTSSLKYFQTRSPYPDGDVEGSKARPRTRQREGNYIDMSLKNTDIKGATTRRTVETVCDPWAGKIDRRHCKTPTLNTADIVGAQAKRSVPSLDMPAVARRHAAAVSHTDQRRDAQMGATGTFTALSADGATVRILSSRLKGWDKDSSGKVTAPEFIASVRASGLDIDSGEMQSLKSGLADRVGLVDYRPFMQSLAATASRIENQKQQQQHLQARPPSSRQVTWVARSSPSTSRPQSAPGAGTAAAGYERTQESSAQKAADPPTVADSPAQQETVDVSKDALASEPAVQQGPHFASVADIVAKAGEMAEQRKARSQSARTLSFKEAHTRERGPKYWFSNSGITRETHAINTAWKASCDPTMLGQNKGLETAAQQGLLIGDSKGGLEASPRQSTSRPGTAGSDRLASGKWTSATSSIRPARDRPGTATMRAGSLDKAKSRPSTARAAPRSLTNGADYAMSFGAREVMPHKQITKAPTPVHRPAPRPTVYTSGARRDRELIKQDMATVRSLA